jgi:arylsulfatase
VQYYYIFGSRAIYQDGWKASLAYPNHFTTGSPDAGKSFDENAWELYNMNEDYTERLDLAKKYPEKLAQMRALFEQQAQEHQLYPLINWDDVMNMRIHRSKDTKSLSEEVGKIAARQPDKN